MSDFELIAGLEIHAQLMTRTKAFCRCPNRYGDAPNTLVSPHFSAPVHDRLERTMAIISENFRRYRAGEKMLNALTREDIYTAG